MQEYAISRNCEPPVLSATTKSFFQCLASLIPVQKDKLRYKITEAEVSDDPLSYMVAGYYSTAPEDKVLYALNNGLKLIDVSKIRFSMTVSRLSSILDVIKTDTVVTLDYAAYIAKRFLIRHANEVYQQSFILFPLITDSVVAPAASTEFAIELLLHNAVNGKSAELTELFTRWLNLNLATCTIRTHIEIVGMLYGLVRVSQDALENTAMGIYTTLVSSGIPEKQLDLLNGIMTAAWILDTPNMTILSQLVIQKYPEDSSTAEPRDDPGTNRAALQEDLPQNSIAMDLPSRVVDVLPSANPLLSSQILDTLSYVINLRSSYLEHEKSQGPHSKAAKALASKLLTRKPVGKILGLMRYFNSLKQLAWQAGYSSKYQFRNNPHFFICSAICKLILRINFLFRYRQMCTNIGDDTAFNIARLISDDTSTCADSVQDIHDMPTSESISIVTSPRAPMQRSDLSFAMTCPVLPAIGQIANFITMQLQFCADAVNSIVDEIVTSRICPDTLQDASPGIYEEFIRPYIVCFALGLELLVSVLNRKISLQIRQVIATLWQSLTFLYIPRIAGQGFNSQNAPLTDSLGEKVPFSNLSLFKIMLLKRFVKSSNTVNIFSAVPWSTILTHLARYTEPLTYMLSEPYPIELRLLSSDIVTLRDNFVKELCLFGKIHRHAISAVAAIPQGFLCNYYAIVVLEFYHSLSQLLIPEIPIIYNQTTNSIKRVYPYVPIIERIRCYRLFNFVLREPFESLVTFDQKFSPYGIFIASNAPIGELNCQVSVAPVPDFDFSNESSQTCTLSPLIFFDIYSEMIESVMSKFLKCFTLEYMCFVDEFQWTNYHQLSDMGQYAVNDRGIINGCFAVGRVIQETAGLLGVAMGTLDPVLINIRLHYASRCFDAMPCIYYSPCLFVHTMRLGITLRKRFSFTYSFFDYYITALLSLPCSFESMISNLLVSDDTISIAELHSFEGFMEWRVNSIIYASTANDLGTSGHRGSFSLTEDLKVNIQKSFEDFQEKLHSVICAVFCSDRQKTNRVPVENPFPLLHAAGYSKLRIIDKRTPFALPDFMKVFDTPVFLLASPIQSSDGGEAPPDPTPYVSTNVLDSEMQYNNSAVATKDVVFPSSTSTALDRPSTIDILIRHEIDLLDRALLAYRKSLYKLVSLIIHDDSYLTKTDIFILAFSVHSPRNVTIVKYMREFVVSLLDLMLDSMTQEVSLASEHDIPCVFAHTEEILQQIARKKKRSHVKTCKVMSIPAAFCEKFLPTMKAYVSPASGRLYHHIPVHMLFALIMKHLMAVRYDYCEPRYYGLPLTTVLLVKALMNFLRTIHDRQLSFFGTNFSSRGFSMDTGIDMLSQPNQQDVTPHLSDSDDYCSLIDPLLKFLSFEMKQSAYSIVVSQPLLTDIVSCSLMPVREFRISTPETEHTVGRSGRLVALGSSISTSLTVIEYLLMKVFMINDSFCRHMILNHSSIIYEYVFAYVKEVHYKQGPLPDVIEKSFSILDVFYLYMFLYVALAYRSLVQLIFEYHALEENIVVRTDNYLQGILAILERIGTLVLKTIPAVLTAALDPLKQKSPDQLSAIYLQTILPIVSMYNTKVFLSIDPSRQVPASHIRTLLYFRIMSHFAKLFRISVADCISLLQNFLPLQDAARLALGYSIEMLYRYLHPLVDTQIVSKSVPLSANATLPNFLYGRNDTQNLVFATGTCDPTVRSSVSNLIATSYIYASRGVSDHALAIEILETNKQAKDALTIPLSFREGYSFKNALAAAKVSLCTFDVDLLAILNPILLERPRRNILDLSSSSLQTLTLQNTSLTSLKTVPISRDIIRYAPEIIRLFAWLVTMRLVSPATLDYLAQFIGKPIITNDITEFIRQCSAYNITPEQLSFRRKHTRGRYSSTVQNTSIPCSNDCILTLQSLSSVDYVSRKLLAASAVPTTAEACCMLNTTRNSMHKYIASLRFYYNLYTSSNDISLVYLMFLVDSLRQDLYAGELLFTIAQQARLFGLYTLIQLAAVFTSSIKPLHHDEFKKVLGLQSSMDSFLESIVAQDITQENQEEIERVRRSIVDLYAYISYRSSVVSWNSLDTGAPPSIPVYTPSIPEGNIRSLISTFVGTGARVLYAYILYLRIIILSSSSNARFFMTNLAFYGSMTRISTELLKTQPDNREFALHKKLKDICTTNLAKEDIVLLSDPEYRIIDINYKTAKVLKSHAKVPYLVNFKTERNSCFGISGGIFKAGDDVSQDQLVLTLISIFRKLYEPLRLWLSPYIALPIGAHDGFIEILRDSKSLDQIGAATEQFLVDYFDKISTPILDVPVCTFTATTDRVVLSREIAKRRFLLSTTAYSLMSYILSLKDRHNGNIMLNSHCNLIHIDFGFIFDIAPGGSFSVEKTPFKLTKDYITLLGGSGSPSYNLFQNLYARGLLLARLLGNDVSTLVEALVFSDLPAIQGRETVINLRARLQMGKSFSEVVDNALHQIAESEKGYTAYDRFQAFQNDIVF